MDRIPVSSFPAGLKRTQGCGPFVSTGMRSICVLLRLFARLEGAALGAAVAAVVIKLYLDVRL